MGQEIYLSKYPPDRTLEPGTYRIFNAQAGTAIQVSEHDPTRVVTWEKHKGENQQWFLQRSGQGYRLQNRHYDAYLAVSNTNDHSRVYASRYPTTWVFLKFNGDYIVQLADSYQVLDLHCCSGHNGNELHIWGEGVEPQKIWRVERLGSDSGNKELAAIQGQVANKDKELSSAKEELSGLRELLGRRDETIRQLQQDLKSKEEALSHAHKANDESADLRDQHGLLESKLSQQQTETASLRAKMGRVEYLMSQLMGKSGGSIFTRDKD
ncbi:unnamed protein product [Rhizoctonia solani]|uniref:Ricin B lectin domain-containing protein n=1 Tax=Rhizoctonia solani TaxID=456999 RepID=A0A8H3DRB3_9AGAM|nr:unnamed protein product [Rhizoctonia solani]